LCGRDRGKHTQNFGKNENQNHADEEPRLLSRAADASITDNADGETCSQTRKTDGKTGAEVDETSVESVAILFEPVGYQDGDDETVDANDTSHNNGDNV
jgi:hypothetical protein